MGEFFVYSFFFGMLLFFFPVFFYVDGYLDARERKCYFALSLYKHIKIYGGYAQLIRDGIAVHLTKKTAVVLSFKDMMTSGKKHFEVTKGFQLYRFHQILEVSGAERPYGVMLAAFIQMVSAQTFSVLKTAHPFLSLKNSTVLVHRPTLKVTLQASMVFNGFVLSMALTKKLLEAVINWIRKRKLTASWKKQPSN